ncbi:MAG TPA: phospholipase [Saprospiraceae bacterium]|nr:phospholipase [Saprospiraceae bacterium]
MRAKKTKNGISLKLYTGTTSVLMSFNVTDARRKGLLGFAVRRKDKHRRNKHPDEWRWIKAMLRFKPKKKRKNASKKYRPTDTNIAPIQKFRWSDYAVYANLPYSYQVIAVYGTPDNLEYVMGPTIKIKTESLRSGKHQVVFNRAVAASQAYARKPFGKTNPDDESDPLHQDARDWLTRGLRQKIEKFIKSAKDDTYALDVAIYEMEYDGIVDLLKKAHEKGVKLNIVYHARKKDPQTADNEKHLKPIVKKEKTPRVTSAIFHQKFMILSKKNAKGQYIPKSVLTGTANFTPNGLWRQANVVHVIRDKKLAKEYSILFAQLLQSKGRGDTKKHINKNHPLMVDKDLFPSFSPRSKFVDIDLLETTIRQAQSELFLCSTFRMHPRITQAIKDKTDIIRYGLQNNRTSITGIHRNKSFTVPAILKNGLEGFLKESTKGQKGNILIHLKTLILDFTTENPTVIVGSHNFSKPASSTNDENFVVIKGNTSVADIYFGEMMRLYDHYRFRFNVRSKKKNKKRKKLYLKPDDSWTNPYFKPGLKSEERVKLNR